VIQRLFEFSFCFTQVVATLDVIAMLTALDVVFAAYRTGRHHHYLQHSAIVSDSH
jgi:hypothetical protein